MPKVRSWKPEPQPQPAVSASSRAISTLLRTSDTKQATISRRIEQGIAFRVFDELCDKLGLTHLQLAKLLGVSPSSLYRRKSSGRFTPAESDRLWRYLRLYARALEVHKTEEAARAWLHAPLPALGRRTALEVSTDSPGAERALGVLGQIEHGVFG